jgi:c-di-GMP-binding flagellar brake protein YcgR
MILSESNVVPIRKGPPRPQDVIAPIPASINAFDMESEDDIGDALTLLAATGDAISMYGQGSREAVLGRILSVDPELPHFVVELNEGETLPHGNITFVACLRTAKLQFRLSDPAWRPVPGKPQHIPMTFPETCAVLNRRSAERVETPLGGNFMASFLMTGNTPHKLTLLDLSLGGIGLRCSKRDAQGLLKGRKVRDVLLELGSETIVIEELEIRTRRAFRSFLLGEQLNIGCKITSLSPEAEQQLQSVLDRINGVPQQRNIA